MLKFIFLTVLTTTSFFQLTTGSPAASILARHDSNEGIYLSSCIMGGYPYSMMVYYSNAKTGSQNRQEPDDSTSVVKEKGVPSRVQRSGGQAFG